MVRQQKKDAPCKTVERIPHYKGWCTPSERFIQPEKGDKDVFVHATSLEAAGIASLNEGD